MISRYGTRILGSLGLGCKIWGGNRDNIVSNVSNKYIILSDDPLSSMWYSLRSFLLTHELRINSTLSIALAWTREIFPVKRTAHVVITKMYNEKRVSCCRCIQCRRKNISAFPCKRNKSIVLHRVLPNSPKNFFLTTLLLWVTNSFASKMSHSEKRKADYYV